MKHIFLLVLIHCYITDPVSFNERGFMHVSFYWAAVPCTTGHDEVMDGGDHKSDLHGLYKGQSLQNSLRGDRWAYLRVVCCLFYVVNRKLK